MNSVTDKKIQEVLVLALKRKHLKIATAESLTGGMISKMITEVSGSSAVLECGICSYSNRIKHDILGVSMETLEKYSEYGQWIHRSGSCLRSHGRAYAQDPRA